MVTDAVRGGRYWADDVLPPDLFTEETLREYLDRSLFATLNVYGLECHATLPDFRSIFQFLGDRFGYGQDDIDHEDVFSEFNQRSSAEPRPMRSGPYAPKCSVPGIGVPDAALVKLLPQSGPDEDSQSAGSSYVSKDTYKIIDARCY